MSNLDYYSWNRIPHISHTCICGGARIILDEDWDDYDFTINDGAVYFLIECSSCKDKFATAQNKNFPKWHFYKYLIKK
jgi:hypothetical protein